MLRVIGGSAKGRKLLGPPERKATPPRARIPARAAGPAVVAKARSRTEILAETRPTSDLIRGVIFDMLDAMEADYDRVLDLYAGTGALGIEALSRGDGTAHFVEQEAAAIAVIRQNLRTCGFEDRAEIHHLTTERVTNRVAGAPYTLILADPPYYDEGAPAVVDAAAASALAGPETVLVYEHHRRLEPPAAVGRLRLYKSRRHGDTVVSIYQGEAFA